jgi:hypothetical protein
MALTAIYYPYSRSLTPLTLRKAALLFDTLYFLDSEPWFIRSAIMRDKLANNPEALNASHLEDDYQLLKAADIVRTLDASNIAQEYDELLTINVMNDIGDDEFCKLAMQHSADTWEILRQRIPPGLLATLYPGAGTFYEAISLQSIINAGGDVNRINDPARRFFSFPFNRDAPTLEEAMQMFLEPHGYRYVIGGNPHIELPAYEFPFLQASSLRINECLVAAAQNGFVPYTDSRIHDSLLRLKVNRALAAVDTQPELRRRLSIDLPLQFPRHSLALEILGHLIPDEALARVAVSDLLQYRSRNVKHLARFHSQLEVLGVEIDEITPGGDYEKKVKKVVSSKVLPELIKTRDDLMTSYQDAFGEIAVSSAVTVASTISATIFGGLDLRHVLLAGILAEGGVIAAKAPTALLTAWKGRRQNDRSSFAYVTGFRVGSLQ